MTIPVNRQRAAVNRRDRDISINKDAVVSDRQRNAVNFQKSEYGVLAITEPKTSTKDIAAGSTAPAVVISDAYLKADGSQQLVANWIAGSYVISAGRFTSTVAAGTAPFSVSSSTVNTKLNADFLDSLSSADFALTAKGVTNGDSHDHAGGDGAQISHTGLANLNSSGYTHLTSIAHTDLTDAGDSTLHYHTADRARAAHTGTQAMATISDLPILSSSTYTPTAANNANLDANPTMFTAQYLRIGSVVTVSGRFTANPTNTATLTSFTMTLPIASNFANAEECGGTAFSPAIASQGAAIYADAVNNLAKVEWISGDITSQDFYFTFTYQVI